MSVVSLPVLLVTSCLLGASSEAVADTTPSAADPARAFDFEFGAWTVELSVRQRPLTGSDEWVVYRGSSVVREVWGGRANLGELDVEGPGGRIQGMSMRLFDPASGEWRVHWANSRIGHLDPPMIGGFDENGIGEFYNQEMFEGRAIFVRFVFSEITETTFSLEQAFSDDGGKRWEANWIARFQRVDAGTDEIAASDEASRDGSAPPAPRESDVS